MFRNFVWLYCAIMVVCGVPTVDGMKSGAPLLGDGEHAHDKFSTTHMFLHKASDEGEVLEKNGAQKAINQWSHLVPKDVVTKRGHVLD